MTAKFIIIKKKSCIECKTVRLIIAWVSMLLERKKKKKNFFKLPWALKNQLIMIIE